MNKDEVRVEILSESNELRFQICKLQSQLSRNLELIALCATKLEQLNARIARLEEHIKP